MANVIYEVMSPDGREVLEIEGPEGASQDAVLAEAEILYRQMLEQRAAQTDVPVLDQYGKVVQPPMPQKPEYTFGEKAVGALEAVGTTLLAPTAILGQIGGTLGATAASILSGEFGTQDAAQRIAQAAGEGARQTMLYTPQTPAGQEYVKNIGEVAANIPPFIPMANELSAATQLAKSAIPQITQPTRAAAKTVKDVTVRTAQGLKEGADEAMDLLKVAPEDKSMGAAQVALARQRLETAEGLPVPVHMTKGALLRDPEQLTFERFQMKQALGGPLRNRVEENNLEILQNFDAFVDMAGDDAAQIVRAGPATAGRTVIDALKFGLKRAKTKTKVAYQQARASGETKAPVDADALIDYVNQAQPEQGTAPIVATIKNMMVRDKIAQIGPDGNLIPLPKVGYDAIMNKPGVSTVTVDDLERLREAINKNVGNNPPDIRQATIVKGIIDQLNEGKGGDLYAKARALRTEQGRTFENRAVVARLVENIANMDDPRVAAEKVFEKSIINSSPDEVAFLRKTLLEQGKKKGKLAWDVIQGAAVDHIKRKALTTATDSAGNPIVSPAALTRTVEQLDYSGHLDAIFGAKRAQQMRDLAEVSRFVATAPPGTIINTSDSANLILAALVESGASAGMLGVPVPVLTVMKASKNWRDKRALIKKINEAVSPSVPQ